MLDLISRVLVTLNGELTDAGGMGSFSGMMKFSFSRIHLFAVVLSLGFPAVALAESSKVEVVVGADSGVVEPFSVIFDKTGVMYGVEFTKANRVFKISPDGKVTFIAGVKATSDLKKPLESVGDGPATGAHFNGLHDLCLTYSSPTVAQKGGPEDVLMLADTFNHRIRRLDLASGTVSTVAGTGKPGYNGDAQSATESQLSQPICISAGARAGDFWITDLGNNRVRSLDLGAGKVKDIVGNGQKGKVKEGARPLESPLNGPRAVAADGKTVWIALREGNALVECRGDLKTVINLSGKAGYSGDGTGDAKDAQLAGPKYLCLDDDGNVLICDTENHVIRRYLPGKNKIELLVGTPQKAGSAIGSTGLDTQLKRPHGMRVYKEWLYIADSENNRVLRLAYQKSK